MEQNHLKGSYMQKYPCKTCLLKLTCSSECDKIKSIPTIVDLKTLCNIVNCPFCGSDIDDRTILKICLTCNRKVWLRQLPLNW